MNTREKLALRLKESAQELRENEQLREELAAYAHEAWAGWMRYMFRFCTDNADGTVAMDAEKVARWKRQMGTPYADLPEEEKRSDRAEADNILAIINPPPVVEPPF